MIKRAKYQNKLNSFKQQGYQIVHVDESGFEAKTIRPYAYAPIAKTCIDRYNWQGKNEPTLLTLCIIKILFALDYIEKKINGNILYDWCKYTLVPSLKTKCVIVMDNASFHKCV